MESSKNPVLLYAYKLSKIFSSDEYAWHISVYVFDYEVSYGNGGITVTKMEEEPTETKIMGYTDRTGRELYNFLEEKRSQWTAETYDVLRNNCQHFANEVLIFLKVAEKVPDGYTELPRKLRNKWGPCVSVSSSIIKLLNKSSGVNSHNEDTFDELVEKDKKRQQIIARRERKKRRANLKKKSTVKIEEISTVQNEFQESSNSNQIAVRHSNQFQGSSNSYQLAVQHASQHVINQNFSTGLERNNQIVLQVYIDKDILQRMLHIITIIAIIFIAYFSR